MKRSGSPHSANWLTAIRRYVAVVTVGNVVWELLQAPLYTIWHTGSGREVAQAILHCSLGDAFIATITLVVALISVGSPAWPDQRFGRVLATIIILAAGYAIYSEYMNTVVRRSWSYTSWMPTLPWFGTGLTPLAQWLVIPSRALAWSRRDSGYRGRATLTPM